MLVFRQMGDPVSSTYTYLLGDRATGEAVLIDPVFDQAVRDAALVEELGLTLAWTLDTHVHADHVTAAWLHKHRGGSRIATGASSGATGADLYLADGETLAVCGLPSYVTLVSITCSVAVAWPMLNWALPLLPVWLASPAYVAVTV